MSKWRKAGKKNDRSTAMEIKDIELRELHKNAAAYDGKEVTVRGWVRQNRNSNKFGFIALNDGSFFKPVQIVYESEKLDNFEEIAKAPLSAGIRVRGTLLLTPEAKQPFEIHAEEVVIEADSAADYPLQNHHFHRTRPCRHFLVLLYRLYRVLQSWE